MRLIVVDSDGVAAVNYMWLPTWIGMNVPFLKKLSEHLRPQLEGLPLAEAEDKGGELAKQFIMEHFSHPGLAAFLAVYS